MEEVRQLVQEEGREARNLVAFHVSVDTPAAPRIAKKPPRSALTSSVVRRPCPRRASRIRSASAGRDKRSELRARYWALLFGDLQRAVDEIYNTVEANENLSECQEVILVLENYTRDFKALCKWFRLKWEYDNTPPPQRPQSLAWEIRKTDFVRPESRRAHSVKSSPSVSGKNSPCLSGNNTPSGKNSPNLVAGKTSPGSGKISPRVNHVTSPKSNVEFFTNKVASKVTAKPEARLGKECRLSDIKEKSVEEKAKEVEDLRSCEANLKLLMKTKVGKVDELSKQAKATIEKMNVMECQFLEKQLIENAVKNENMMNNDRDLEEMAKVSEESPTKSEDNYADVSSVSSRNSDDVTVAEAVDTKKEEKDEPAKEESKKDEKKDVKPTRPAYSQAAAKPKVVTKPETKVQKTQPLIRSKTVVEIRPATNVPKTQKFFPKRTQNKCSYPFNLTTGRTLFDAPSKTGVKKPTKTEDKKIDRKVVPKRPTTLKINDKNDNKEMHPLEKIKDCEEYSSTDTVVTQIDVSRIDSSESLKTLMAEDPEFAQDVAHSMEVLNYGKNDNEGWSTVKSRRLSRESKKQSKSHWSNRFNQPSATTSLPTLNMIESPKQETKSILTKTKLDRAKSEQPEIREKVVKVNASPKKEKSKDVILRQKSDVTGLKTRSARNKALTKKKDSKKNSDLTKNRLHSSLESLTGLSRSQEVAEEPFDFDKWKAEFKSTFKYLDEDDTANDNEILKSADPSEMSEIAEMTSQIEENERKISLALDFQSEVDQRKLSEEEDSLNRQIMELQQVSDVDLDTETDDTETDAEVQCDDSNSITNSIQDISEYTELSEKLSEQYETALAGMSWAERRDTLVQLEALVAGDPGRAQQLHAKLSQGIKRRGSIQDALRRLQAKQARAEQHRQDLQSERTKKIHSLLARVEEVKMAKNQLIDEKRNRMERRLQKATENRDQHLKDIVRKAHDEEEKLREIAFIKQLEAENRRHEFLEQCRTHTCRLRQVRRDRLSKLEQKSQHEAAVGARRLALEQARRLHVETLLEKRKERDARVEELKEQKKQERDDAAREKAEGVRFRLSALALAAELEADALRSRIEDKQAASRQRLASHLQARRTRATGPRLATSENPDPEQNAKEELEQEMECLNQEKKERERQKALKKRARKLRLKLMVNGQEFEDTNFHDTPMTLNNKITKTLNQINNIITNLQLSESKDKMNGNDNRHSEPKEINEKKKNKKKKGNSQERQLDDINDNDNNTHKKVDNTNDVDKNDVNDIGINKNVSNKTADDKVPENGEAKKSKKSKKSKSKDENVKSDKSKLSKTSSVTSSLSDMSKISGRSDRKSFEVDWMYFEKLLSELNRCIEKVDKNCSPDNQIYLYSLKILNQLIHLAAEKEENGMQITTKSLTTSIQVIITATSSCARAASYYINTNCCLHIVKLLAGLLEKDNISDKGELTLTRLCIECLTQALDSVRFTTQMYEKVRNESGYEKETALLASMRARAHGVISYLCLSGCLSGTDIVELQPQLHTMIIVCASLCHYCDVDSGQEKPSAIQLLRSTLSVDLCGARTVFCSLFDEGSEVDGMKVARVTKLLRVVAELDHCLVQEAFGEGPWPLEFRAAVARLLSKHAPTDREMPGQCGNQTSSELSEEIVIDLIVLIGLVVVNNTQHMETLCEGWSAVRLLCYLPANWILTTHSHALLPTLAALSQYANAQAIIASELSVEMIEEYLDSPESQNVRLVRIIKEGRRKDKNTKK